MAQRVIREAYLGLFYPEGQLDEKIAELQSAMDKAKENNYWDVRIVNDSWSGDPSFSIYADRYETDAEYKKRIRQEKQKKETAKEKEYREYLKLKKKFERELNK